MRPIKQNTDLVCDRRLIHRGGFSYIVILCCLVIGQTHTVIAPGVTCSWSPLPQIKPQARHFLGWGWVVRVSQADIGDKFQGVDAIFDAAFGEVAPYLVDL